MPDASEKKALADELFIMLALHQRTDTAGCWHTSSGSRISGDSGAFGNDFLPDCANVAARASSAHIRLISYVLSQCAPSQYFADVTVTH